MKNSILETAKLLLTIESKAIQDAANRLGDEIEKSLELIEKAQQENKKLIFLGMGKSHYIAHKLAASFMSTGLTAIFLHPSEALHGDLGNIKSGDLVFAISKSGATGEILALLPHLKKQNKIIAIVGNAFSPLAEESDVFLNASVEKEACPINMLPTASTTVALALGDALLATYCEKINFSRADFSKLHPGGSIGKRLHSYVRDVMLPMGDFAFGSPEQSLQEVAQQMSEKSLGAFCVVDKDFQLLGIVVEGDLRRSTAREISLDVKVSEIMETKPVKLTAELSLDEALALLERKEKQITSAPVVDDDNKLLGYVRIHDLI